MTRADRGRREPRGSLSVLPQHMHRRSGCPDRSSHGDSEMWTKYKSQGGFKICCSLKMLSSSGVSAVGRSSVTGHTHLSGWRRPFLCPAVELHPHLKLRPFHPLSSCLLLSLSLCLMACVYMETSGVRNRNNDLHVCPVSSTPAPTAAGLVAAW